MPAAPPPRLLAEPQGLAPFHGHSVSLLVPPRLPHRPAAYSNMEEMALNACVSAVTDLNSTRTTCAAVEALGAKALAVADPAAACSAAAAALCMGGDCSTCAAFLATFKVRGRATALAGPLAGGT